MPVSARAAAPIANIVGEEAPLIVLVNDVPGLIKNWGNSPMARMLADPEIIGFFDTDGADPMDFSGLDAHLKQEFGHSVKELLAFARGDALFAIQRMQGLPLGMPPVLAIVELGDNAAKLDALLTSKAFQEKTGLVRETMNHDGVTLHHDKHGGDGGFIMAWAISEGTLYCSLASGLVGGALDRVGGALESARAGGVSDAFGKSERYLRMKERAGGAHVLLAVNLQEIVPLLDTMLKMQAANASPVAAAMVDLANLSSHLGLDTARDFYAGARLAEEHAEITCGLTHAEARGLLKIITAAREGPFVQPPFLTADNAGVCTVRFSLPAFYDVVEEIVKTASPMGRAMIEERLAAFNRQNGIDIKRDLIGSFGDDLFTVSRNPQAGSATPGAQDIAFVFPLKDERLFASTLNTLKKAAGLEEGGRLEGGRFSSRDYLGATIYTLEHGIDPAGRISHAVMNGHFIIGLGPAASAVESVIQGMAGKADSIWSKPEIIESLADVPGDAFAYRYEDMAKVMEGFFDTLDQTMRRAAAIAASDSPGAKRAFGPKPGAATLEKYWGGMFGFNQRDARGIYGKAWIYYKNQPISHP
jgi:hypothetical protein